MNPSPSTVTKPSFPLRVWNFLTSFKLAVLVFAVSILLVFFGTLAQVHEGLYLAQERWFKSWFVVRQSGDVWWTPPVFPGGYLLGTIFLINMLGAHFRRFKFPPGGWLTLILHYLLVMAALFAITRYLLWTPMFFALSLLCLLGADFFLCMLGKKLPASGRKIGIDAVHLGIALSAASPRSEMPSRPTPLSRQIGRAHV